MGKIFVLSVTDHEEYVLSRIMEIIAAESGFDHIAPSNPCNTLAFPGLELRLKERTAYRNGELISMTRREFATLVYLAKHPSWVFSAGQIYEEVWGEDSENCGTAVASVIGQIRRKLTPDMPKAGYIRTVLGSGCLDPHFRFVAPLHQGAAAVVGHEDAGGRKEYSSGAGTADLRGVDPHFFHFSGTEKSRIDNPAASVTIRRKNCRFFIPIHTYTRIIHGHIGFCQAV